MCLISYIHFLNFFSTNSTSSWCESARYKFHCYISFIQSSRTASDSWRESRLQSMSHNKWITIYEKYLLNQWTFLHNIFFGIFMWQWGKVPSDNFLFEENVEFRHRGHLSHITAKYGFILSKYNLLLWWKIKNLDRNMERCSFFNITFPSNKSTSIWES